MVSVCPPSDALSQHLPFYLGFSYLGRGVSLHGCSSKAEPLLLTLEEGYLLMATPPDLERGVAPLSPSVPVQQLLLGGGVAPLHKAYRWLKAWLMIEFRMRLRFMHMCVLSHFSCVWLFATLWIVVSQAPLFMGFSKQEYWRGLPCPPPGDLPDPGIRIRISCVFCFAGRFFTAEPPQKPLRVYTAKWTPSGSWNLPFPCSFDVSDETTLSILQKCNFFLLLLCDCFYLSV